LAIKKKITDFKFKENKQRTAWSSKRKRASKHGGKRILFVFGGIAAGLFVGLSLFSIYKWLAVSEFFQITSIKIEGERRLDKQQILALSGVTVRTNLLAMKVDSVKRKIEAHGWVEKAVITRSLPSDLTIQVYERVPVALVNTGKGLFYADKRGVVFAEANPPEDLDFPVITGLEKKLGALAAAASGAEQKEVKNLDEALTFIKYAGNGSSSLPRQNISEIHVAENGEYIVFLADNPFPIYIGTEVSTKRYYRLAKVLYWLYKKREFSDVNFIRMDYMENKVLVGKTDADER
jgi:cell division protein FtsQ